MSIGLMMEKSTSYSTRPCALRGARSMFTIVASTGSLGSATPNARPVSFSYWPISPKACPSKVGDSTLSTTSLLMRESGERCACAAVPLGDWPRPSGVVGVHARTAIAKRTARRFIPRPPPLARRRRVGQWSIVCAIGEWREAHHLSPSPAARNLSAEHLVRPALNGAVDLVGRQEATAPHRTDLRDGAQTPVPRGTFNACIDRFANDRAHRRRAPAGDVLQAPPLVPADPDVKSLCQHDSLVPDREPDLRALAAAAEDVAVDEDRGRPAEVGREDVLDLGLDVVPEPRQLAADRDRDAGIDLQAVALVVDARAARRLPGAVPVLDDRDHGLHHRADSPAAAPIAGLR